MNLRTAGLDGSRSRASIVPGRWTQRLIEKKDLCRKCWALKAVANQNYARLVNKIFLSILIKNFSSSLDSHRMFFYAKDREKERRGMSSFRRLKIIKFLETLRRRSS